MLKSTVRMYVFVQGFLLVKVIGSWVVRSKYLCWVSISDRPWVGDLRLCAKRFVLRGNPRELSPWGTHSCLHCFLVRFQSLLFFLSPSVNFRNIFRPVLADGVARVYTVPIQVELMIGCCISGADCSSPLKVKREFWWRGAVRLVDASYFVVGVPDEL